MPNKKTITKQQLEDYIVVLKAYKEQLAHYIKMRERQLKDLGDVEASTATEPGNPPPKPPVHP